MDDVRRCDHNTTTHDYTTDQDLTRTLRTDRVCDACGDTIQTFWQPTPTLRGA